MLPFPPELLLAILFWLSPRDTKAAACVCRDWRDVVATLRRQRTRQLIDYGFRWLSHNPGKFVLAGGAAVWLNNGEPKEWTPGDVDVFLCVEEDDGVYTDGLGHEVTLKGHSLCDVVRDIKYPCVGTVQVILSYVCSSPKRVLRMFDLTCTMVGFISPENRVLGDKYTAIDQEAQLLDVTTSATHIIRSEVPIRQHVYALFDHKIDYWDVSRHFGIHSDNAFTILRYLHKSAKQASQCRKYLSRGYEIEGRHGDQIKPSRDAIDPLRKWLHSAYTDKERGKTLDSSFSEWLRRVLLMKV